MSEISPKGLEIAVSSIATEINSQLLKAQKTRPEEFGLWAELSCCVLSSQVPYDLAKAASQRIMDSGVLSSDSSPNLQCLRSQLLSVLSPPIAVGGVFRRYRFPARRAHQIASTFCVVHHEFGSLNELLNRYPDARSARVWMVKNMQGVGPKQASMFLRNIAVSYDLAVIDRHVCRYIHVIGFGNAEPDVATIRNYEKREAQLRIYAANIGCSLGVLDWAIWIVMRAASRIEQQ